MRAEMESAFELDPPLKVDLGVGRELAGGEVDGRGKTLRQPATSADRSIVGVLIALQAPINSGLGKATGTFAAAAISFTVGTLLLLAIVVVTGKLGERLERRRTCLVLPASAACSAPPT